MNRVVGKVLTKAYQRATSAAARKNNSESVSESKKVSYKKKRTEYRSKQASYRQEHLEEESSRHSAYFQKNKGELTDKHCAYKKERRQVDEAFVLNERCHQRLKNFLKAKGDPTKMVTFKHVGKTPKELLVYLKESAGVITIAGMQIDHIFPVSGYERGQHGMMTHFSNLQLLTASENNYKNARLPTKAMAAKVAAWAWPEGVTADMLPDKYPGWSTGLRK